MISDEHAGFSQIYEQYWENSSNARGEKL